MSIKHILARVLVYLVLEIGALVGVPMRPDEIEKLLQIHQRNAVILTQDEEED